MNNETITMYTLDEAREILLEEKRKNKRKIKQKEKNVNE